jgi:hypothetical protein
MERKLKIIAMILTGAIESVTLNSWLLCKNFTDIFHHSSINLNLQIEDYVHAEKGTSLVMTRVFNNKIIDSLINLLRFYFQFWDIRFGSNWFSIVGYFGIFAGFYYITVNNKKKFIHWTLLILIILLPWIEILIEPHVSLIVKSLYLWVPFILFSMYGIYQFLNHGKIKTRVVILLLLILFSLWWLAYLQYDIPRYCVR